MAQEMSPLVSPTVARKAHEHSPSPVQPAIAPSKRDKRRAMLSERLNEMMDSFTSNQFDFYFAQLSAIQSDINLIMRAEPFGPVPLDNSPEAISELVDGVRRETTRHRPIASDAEDTFGAMKGRFYSQFVDEINAAMEQRDADLTMAYEQYRHGLDELHRTNQYKVQLAQEEHRLLSNTLRERLIQGVTQKKARLLRDKEQLDIADSNALLLNPNQFSLGNPTSPGGPQNSRKTRHTRLRPGEVDEVGAGGVQDGSKRKRKLGQDDNEVEPPISNGRLGEVRVSTPFRDARAKVIHSQFEAPLYSIDRLFTEKELALNLSRAHLATAESLAQSQMQINGTSDRRSDYETAGEASAAEHTQEAIGEMMDVEGQGTDASNTAMVTGASVLSSNTYHATRSTHRAPPNPLSDLANAATTLAPFPPVQINTASGKSGPPHAPSWPGLSDAEVQSDLGLMHLDPADPLVARLTERCIYDQSGTGHNTGAWTVAGPPDADEHGPSAAAASGLVAGLNAAAVAMTRHGSGMGFATGGISMSRNTSMMSEGGTGGVSAADFGWRNRRGMV